MTASSDDENDVKLLFYRSTSFESRDPNANRINYELRTFLSGGNFFSSREQGQTVFFFPQTKRKPKLFGKEERQEGKSRLQSSLYKKILSPCCAQGCVPSGLLHPRAFPSRPSWISTPARQVAYEGEHRHFRKGSRKPLLDVDAWTRWCRCTKGTSWEGWLDIHHEDEGHETYFFTAGLSRLTAREMIYTLPFHPYIWVLTDFQFLFLRSAFRYHVAFS